MATPKNSARSIHLGRDIAHVTDNRPKALKYESQKPCSNVSRTAMRPGSLAAFRILLLLLAYAFTFTFTFSFAFPRGAGAFSGMIFPAFLPRQSW
jgi:hypothetical protein